ncbi:MAG TPA: hypothetical protein VGD78_11720 [Chthoniobacterales bacterium]
MHAPSQKAMFQRVFDLATAPHFLPFVLVAYSGTRYRICSRDHVFFVRDDEGKPVEGWFEVVTGARAFYIPPDTVSSIELQSAISGEVR